MIDGLLFSASGLRISKPGHDAASSDLDDFLVHESMPLELIVGGARLLSALEFREPVPLTPGYYTSVTRFPHDLGYAPVVELIGCAPGYDVVAESSETDVAIILNSATTTYGYTLAVDPPLVLLIYGSATP